MHVHKEHQNLTTTYDQETVIAAKKDNLRVTPSRQTVLFYLQTHNRFPIVLTVRLSMVHVRKNILPFHCCDKEKTANRPLEFNIKIQQRRKRKSCADETNTRDILS